MTVGQMVQEFKLHHFNPGVGEEREVVGGYVGDLLSHVMANCQKDNGWITILTNLNTIAVATLTEAACIILPEGIQPEPAVLAKASEEQIPVLGSKLNAFLLCGQLMGSLEK